jgi:hypothetical protein
MREMDSAKDAVQDTFTGGDAAGRRGLAHAVGAVVTASVWALSAV